MNLLSYNDIITLNYVKNNNYIFDYSIQENYVNAFFNIVNSYIGNIDKGFYYIEK